MRRLLVLLPLSVLAVGRTVAQSDSSAVADSMIVVPPPATEHTSEQIGPRDWRARHIPKRATLYSAVLPGAGQIYNRKYWKAPIVWAGLGTCAYFAVDNNTQFLRYKTAYLAMVDSDPNTVDEFEGRYQPDQLRQVANTYQRWRDLSYMVAGLVYLLNIVDATVDGNFVRFDVGRDLSLGLSPAAVQFHAYAAPGVTISLYR